MNKNDLIQKIKLLDGITPDERAYLINLVNTKKKYGLVWEDKPEDVEEQLRTQLPVLKEVVEKRIIASPSPSKGGVKNQKQNLQANLFDTTDDEKITEKSNSLPLGEGWGGAAPNHILIEGDNLHALTALTFTHEGKIDVMYFDPPYNTGNKDFKYNDSFVDKEDSYRHSKWLSFMHKRLEIAKRLLSDKGVIFISIDDNEQAQLKMLCDDIFGEVNFIGEIVWFKKRKGSFLSNQLISLTEYILPYGKGEPIQLYGGTPNNSESQPIVKRTNSRKILSFKGNFVNTKLKNGLYQKGTYGEGSIASILLNDIEIFNGKIVSDFSIEAPFVWTQEFLDKEIDNGTEILINTLNFQVRVIRHNNISIKAMPSFIDGRDIAATNEDAYELLKYMFHSDRPFDYSKPVNLIKKIIESATYYNKTSTILDIFAGSGTTLHATMQLNSEDGGNRQCILVTNNENNICEEVTYERNKRVIQGYTNSKGNWVDGLTNNNLRYYKTDFVSRQPNLKNKRELTRLATELLCIKEDCYTPNNDIITDKNIRVFENDKIVLMVIYDDTIIDKAVELIKTLIKNSEADYLKKIKVYVFSNGQYPYTEEFEEVLEYVTLCALPDAIYKAYQNVLPKKQREIVPELEEEILPTEESTLFNQSN